MKQTRKANLKTLEKIVKVDVYIPNISKYFLNCIEEKHSAKDEVMIGRKYFSTRYHKILTADRAKICC